MPPTPFMGLTLPTVSVTLGPLWATEVNAAFTQVDAHDHTVGNGVPVPTSGISLNADLPFNSFNATLLRSTRFVNQSSPISGPADLTALYVSGNNLYYNNGVGQQVQITQGAGLDASSVGGFGGDYGTSTASAFYTSATSTFTFWQAPNVSALMDMGAVTIHPTNSDTLGVTLKASTSLSSSYNLTFPISLPISTKILTVDASGAIGDVYDVDNSTIVVSSNTLQVPNGGIGTAQLAPGAITFPILPVPNFQGSGSSGSFTSTASTFQPVTNFSIPITSQGGRPIEVSFQWDGNGGPSPCSIAATAQFELQVIRNGTLVHFTSLNETAGVSQVSMSYPPGGWNFTDFGVVGSGNIGTTYTYSVFVKMIGAGQVQVINCTLNLRETL